MGCAGSKPDDLPAVALCRERCKFLEEAIRHRYALAEAHVAYIHSLKLIGHSLHNFIEHDFSRFGGEPPSPELNLPPRKKGDPLDEGPSSPKKSAVSHHSHSNSGSHIEFHSDSEDEDDSETHSLHHSDHSSPLHSNEGGHIAYSPVNYPNYGNMGQEPGPYPGAGGGFMHMNFMRNKATPSVVYEQRPMDPETMRMEIGESSSSSYNPYSYPGNNPAPNSYPNYGYPNSNSNSNYSNFNNYPGYGSAPPPPAVASSSKPPPAPPSPPKTSAWDFLNLFESYESTYPSYTPSRNSREVREEEGIPDLEDEVYQHEVVKEVHGHQKFVDTPSHSQSPVDEKDGKVEAEASLYQTRPSAAMENDRVEYDVQVVEKKVVNDAKAEERGNVAQGGPRDVTDVAREIEVQFVRASDSGNEISNMLEVGKFPYKRKHVSKMLHVVTPSLSVVSSRPSTSKAANPSSSAEDASPATVNIPDDLARGSRNLSSTLHKLFLWEKKLYNEVKAEEKLRIDHEKKSNKLKRMDERGAEADKIKATQEAISELSTKIRIAIQVVDKISVTINKIRDEELWPQLTELIQGLNRMWRSMLECHQSQCAAIREAKLGSLGSHKKLGDTHLEATSQLEHELLNWTLRFSSWIFAQKGYVTALNNWLFKCLLYEPETTEDGVVPFSPGRLGAPPVFVICHQWAQAVDRISEKEVVNSMRVFSTSVFQLWEHDKTDMRERMMANKDLERKVKNLDREDQKIQKEIHAVDKKIVLLSGDSSGLAVYQSDTSSSNLHGHLLRIFEAMEKFAAQSLKAYEGLLQRAEEETAAQQQEQE